MPKPKPDDETLRIPDGTAAIDILPAIPERTSLADAPKGKPRGTSSQLVPFKPGDPRINRKGRPHSFDALRVLAKEIAHEPARGPDGKVLTANGKGLTVAEVILRRWFGSKDFRQQQMALEVAFGKVPNEIKINVEGLDIDAAIERELARLAGQEQSGDVDALEDAPADFSATS